MGFQQGLSGLAASSMALDAIGNNVANSGTAGFKGSTAQFADVYAASLGGGGAGQVGIGANVSRVAQQFSQGNISSSNNSMDMAINGNGMFRVMNTSGAVTYTRAGQFQLDKDGYVISSSGGLKLTGYSADSKTGVIAAGNLVPIQIQSSNIAPQVTSACVLQASLRNKELPPTAMSQGSLTGAITLPTAITITQGSNDVLQLTVDGNNVLVTIPAKTYQPAEMVTTLKSMINSALSGTGASVTVSTGTSGGLIIQSDSKGTLGSAGNGSTVTLNGLGGSAAGTLLGAPVAADGVAGPPATAGTLTGGVTLPTSVTIGSGESFSLTVDGVTKTISLDAGTYTTTGASPTQLETQLITKITAAAFATAPTVSALYGSALTITSPTTGLASNVSISAMTSGIEPLFGPATVAGADNFNVVSGKTSGTLTSGTALVATAGTPLVIAAGTNDSLNLTIDGNAVSVTLAAVSYDGTAGKTLPDLATDIQTKLNAALSALVPVTTARVTVSVNSANRLVISSNSTGTDSSVTLTGTGGTSIATLFGTAPNGPVTLAGNQTQTVNPLGYNWSDSDTVYDTQGGAHTLTYYFVKTSQANVWQLYTTLDGGQQTGPTTLTFDGNGDLITPMPLTLPSQGSSYTFTASSTNAATPNPLQFTVDLTGSTQASSTNYENAKTHDGYASGQLSSISIGADGIIQGGFSNGQTKAMGQVVLVNFKNPNGLQSLGGNQWMETSTSGQPSYGVPGTGSLGLIKASAIEESNVDLTKELVAMITQQRIYQANAQTIKTQDQVLQTLVNMR